MWRRLKEFLGLEARRSGPFFVIHRRYQIEAPFPQYDARRPFRILSFLEMRKLLRRGALRRPRPATIPQLQLVHTAEYLRSLEVPGALQPILGAGMDTRAQDQFLCFQRLMTGGTLRAVRLATRWNTVAVNLGGGFHHAAPASGSGFCVFNDAAIAVRAMRSKGWQGRVLIVDLDLHDGDGTRNVFADDKTVHTFSVHNKTLGRPEAQASTCIALGPDVGDAEYLAALREHLPPVFADHRPDLVIYLAGSDPGARDKLGNWHISLDGMLERDRLVMNLVHPPQGRPLPCAILLAGGYGPHAWRHGAAFFQWLLSGEERVDIPLEMELPLDHYRRLSRLMSRPDPVLAGPQNDGDDWGLQEEELGMPGARPTALFLGTFSRYAVEYAMVEFGLMERLHRLGFKELRTIIDLEDPLGHTIRVQNGGENSLVVMELKLRVDRRLVPGRGVLVIEWLLLQDHRSRYEMSRPLLPGQENPGLGLLRHVTAVLIVLCERLELDGLYFTPSHYHLASLARPVALCPDPAVEGRFRALQDTLKGIELRQAGLTVEEGGVLDENEGRPLVWEPAPLVIPVRKSWKAGFAAPDYQEAMQHALQTAQYSLVH